MRCYQPQRCLALASTWRERGKDIHRTRYVTANIRIIRG